MASLPPTISTIYRSAKDQIQQGDIVRDSATGQALGIAISSSDAIGRVTILRDQNYTINYRLFEDFTATAPGPDVPSASDIERLSRRMFAESMKRSMETALNITRPASTQLDTSFSTPMNLSDVIQVVFPRRPCEICKKPTTLTFATKATSSSPELAILHRSCDACCVAKEISIRNFTVRKLADCAPIIEMTLAQLRFDPSEAALIAKTTTVVRTGRIIRYAD